MRRRLRLRRPGALFEVAVIMALAAGPEAAAAPASSLRFHDVTAEAGISFKHSHGGTGRRYYIETVPPGHCWFDFDGDGWLDLYIVQSGPLPGSPRADGDPHAVLYRNRGDGTFVDVARAAGVENGDGYGNGCTAADFDNDGDTDLYVTNFGPSVLYRNDGDGKFTDVTESAGIANGLYAASAAWADYDNDGRLDLYVANYVDFTMETEKYCGNLRQKRRSYCHPDAYGGLPDVLYHNEGGGRFKEVAEASGIRNPNGKGLGVVWFDYDADGDVDLYVANDATPNMLYRNEGNGRFKDVTLLAGVCCNEDGKPESGMGTEAGDADGDGWLDLVVTNLSNETNQLYRNLQGKGPFTIDTFPSGLGEISLLTTGWGVDLFDFDNDADLDLVITNGHPMDDIGTVSDIITHAERPFLFENDGRGRFREVGRSLGSYFQSADVGRGLTTSDFDNDGDRDLMFTPNDRPARLLRNDGGDRAGGWITLKLRGVSANRDAIGARVEITSGGKTQVEEVRSATSYLSQHDMRLHFGIGAATRVDKLVIRWPNRSGTVETLGPIEAGGFVLIEEGKGIVGRSAAGEASPR